MTIDEILERFGTSVSPVATLKNMKNPLVKTENINQAKADLIELIKSSKPERAVRDDKKLPADANSTMIYNKEAHNNMVDGYNHALYEYEKNLLQAIGEIK